MSTKALLKARVKACATEAKILCELENRYIGTHWGYGSNVLQNNRVHVLRPKARIYNLAYGFLKGNPYFLMEGIHCKTPLWRNNTLGAKVFKTILEFTKNHSTTSEEALYVTFLNWVDEGKRLQTETPSAFQKAEKIPA